MKKSELILLKKILDVLLKRSGNVKFNYLLVQNLNLIEDECNALEKSITYTDDFKKYEQERISICKKYADKDNKGNPIMSNGIFHGLENNAEFNDKMVELKEKYKDIIDEQLKKNEEYEKLLNEDIEEPDFKKIPVDLVPNDIVVGNDFKVFSKLLKMSDFETAI